MDADAGSLRAILIDTLGELGFILLPTVVLLVIAALGAGLVQNGLVVSTEPVKPALEKISLGKGVKRLFSVKSLAEFAKGVSKLAIVGAVSVAILWPDFHALELLPSMEVLGFWDYMWALSVRLRSEEHTSELQ